MNIEEILKPETHGETGFVSLLSSLVPIGNCYPSRSGLIAESPRIEVKLVAGPSNSTDHDHVFQNQIWRCPDSWECDLLVEVITNRTTDQTAPKHTDLLGSVRAKLAKMYAVNTSDQGFNHPVMALIDIRDSGTVDSWEDEKNLDHSLMAFFVVLQVRKDVWPDNPN